MNSAEHFKQLKDKLAIFVSSGQLGVFGSGYWAHKAMKLSPEINLIAVAHYFQALDYQRKVNQIVSILGSKTPHIQNLAVGGVANAINMNSQSTLTLERLTYIKNVIDDMGDFVNKVYLVDVAAIGALYADWTKYGAGITNCLSVPDLPIDTKGTQFESVFCEVVHQQRGSRDGESPQPSGIGVDFQWLDAATAEALRAAVEERAARYLP